MGFEDLMQRKKSQYNKSGSTIRSLDNFCLRFKDLSKVFSQYSLAPSYYRKKYLSKVIVKNFIKRYLHHRFLKN